MRSTARAGFPATTKNLVCAAFLATLSLCASAASAQTSVDKLVAEEAVDRSEYMLTARARAVAIPGFILGIWFDEHATHWSDGQANMAYGAEFAWRKRGDYELSFSVEWADLSMSDAFWREKNDPIEESRYTQLDMQLASFVFASYWIWDPKPWLSPYVGGGIGAGLVLGSLTKYKVRAGSACADALSGNNPLRPPSCYGDDGQPTDASIERDAPEREDLPSIVPILHAAAGLRFHIAEHGVIKLEVGLHDYIYGGISVGAQWW
jgi:opacity protein-like surface antigen